LARVIKIESQNDLENAFRIREEVFVLEQLVRPEEEFDEFEQNSNHFLAISNQGKAIGTARWRQTVAGIKLERFAVLKRARGYGIGHLLLDAVLNDIKRSTKNSSEKLYLHAQLEVVPFYQKYGFETVGKIFEECGIRHLTMEKSN